MLIESNGHEIDLAAFATASSNRYGISPRVQHLLLGQPVHERMLVYEYLVHKALPCRHARSQYAKPYESAPQAS